MKSILWAACLLVLVRPGIDLSAQVNPYKDGTPGVSGYRSEVLAEVMIQEDKFLRLAEAIPADKYTWRPAPDVRSFAEVFLHVSAANYNIYKLVGTPPPAGVDVKGLESRPPTRPRLLPRLRTRSPMPARRSRLCPTPTSTRAWTGSAERTPSAECSCLLSAMRPSISGSRSPMRVSSEWFRRGPKTPRSSRNQNQRLRPRRSSNNRGKIPARTLLVPRPTGELASSPDWLAWPRIPIDLRRISTCP
jgi:hypothetical protein